MNTVYGEDEWKNEHAKKKTLGQNVSIWCTIDFISPFSFEKASVYILADENTHSYSTSNNIKSNNSTTNAFRLMRFRSIKANQETKLTTNVIHASSVGAKCVGYVCVCVCVCVTFSCSFTLSLSSLFSLSTDHINTTYSVRDFRNGISRNHSHLPWFVSTLSFVKCIWSICAPCQYRFHSSTHKTSKTTTNHLIISLKRLTWCRLYTCWK